MANGNSQLSRLKNTLLQVAERLESLEHHDHEGEITELELKMFRS